MLYSIEERLSIYKQAYERLNHEIYAAIDTHICPNLLQLSKYKRIDDSFSIKKEFPEFYAQKPPGVEENKSWWKDNKHGNAKRRKALLNAIAMCNTEIKNRL